MKLSRMRIGVVVAFFAIFFAAVGAAGAVAVQSHMLKARTDLNSALSELNMATPDKGGHRNSAINSVKSAIYQVNLGIHYAK